MLTIQQILEKAQLEVTIEKRFEPVEIQSIGALDSATSGQLTFLSSAKYKRHLETTLASAVLVTENFAELVPESCCAVIVKDPYFAYAKVSQLFDQTPKVVGIHETAVVAGSAKLGHNVAIGPNAVIGENVELFDGVSVGAGSIIDAFTKIGANTTLMANVTIGHRVELGQHCKIQSGTVIGSNGFGYAPNQGQWEPIAQLGTVVIGDRVEIGANCSIDRGAVENTVIEDDVIIDNLVQVAHNVHIGKGTALAGQAGIAGSANIGSGCTVGGSSAIAGHIDIADGTHFAGGSMVSKGTKEPGMYASVIPATTHREWRKMVARIRQLESIVDRISALEKNINQEEQE